MNEKKTPEFQINVFALPNQTTVLFVLIVVVFLAPVIVGSLTTSPILSWPLALGILIFPLRSILKHPERNLMCNDLSPAGEEFSGLSRVIITNAETLSLRRKPRLMISSRNTRLFYTFGSFRHWYIAVDKQSAKTMQARLADPESAPLVHAEIIHELYHFKTGDHWQLGYVGELLRVNFSLMVWAMIFFLGFGLFLITAIHDFLEFDMQAMLAQMELTPELKRLVSQIYLSPLQIEEMREVVSQIDLRLLLTHALSVIWPFVIVGLIIWKIYWPRLWRTREFYANAGMVSTQAQIMPAIAVVTTLPLDILRQKLDEIVRPKYYKRRTFTGRSPWQTLKENIERLKTGSDLKKIIKNLKCDLRLFPEVYHMNTNSQIAALLNPNLIFEDWKAMAVLVGSLMILLEMLLLTPFTFLTVGEWPMHFTTLTTIILVALNYLVPAIATQKSVRTGLLKMVAVVGGIRFLLILGLVFMLIFMLIAMPDTLYEMLCDAVSIFAGYAGNSTEACYEDLESFVIQAAVKNLAQAIVMPLLIICALGLIHFLVRRVFTWYSFPNAKHRLMGIIYSCIIVVSLFWGLSILPLVTDFILRPVEVFNVTTLVFEALGFLIAVIAGILFLRADRKYAHHCPKCDAIVNEDFYPGKRCCGELLHPWLVMVYDL